MNHRDQSISDITIVIKPAFADRLQEVVEELNEAGVGITCVNDDVAAIEGSCESNRVCLIEKMDFVEAVRTTFSYIADYPPGDPRDQDGAETE
jgi:fructose-1,6-bisphosphatase/sedoheptulose 1,7-bisphosphatase-like protein